MTTTTAGQGRRSPPSPSCAVRPLLLIGCATAVCALVAALLLAGGAPQALPDGLPGADRATRWLVPVSRLAVRLAGLGTVGALLARHCSLGPPAPAAR